MTGEIGGLRELCACLRGEPTLDLDWDKVVALASEHWLVPALSLSIQDAKLDRLIPSDVHDYVKFIHLRNTRRNLKLREQLSELLSHLNDAGIEPILTKGAAELLSPSPGVLGSTIMTDLDVLVTAHEVKSTVAVLRRLGYWNVDNLGWVRQSDAGMIDLHYPPGRFPRYMPSAEALSNEVHTAELGRTRARVLSAERRVSHLVIHDTIKDGHWWLGDFNFRHLYQMYRIASQSRDFDWSALGSMMPDQLSKDALSFQLLALDFFFGHEGFEPHHSANWRVKWNHRRRVFQWQHARMGVALRHLSYAPWLLRRARVYWFWRHKGHSNFSPLQGT